MSSDTQVWLSPAKINLFLHITGQRADGMHELQTAFQFIDLHDEMKFEILEDIAIERGEDIPGVSIQEDLSIKAARVLQSKAQVSQGVKISIQKNIPMGGGLGGASSNAATTLLVLNRLWQAGLSIGELAALGEQLGADVPVFVGGQAAWAEAPADRCASLAPWRAHA